MFHCFIRAVSADHAWLNGARAGVTGCVRLARWYWYGDTVGKGYGVAFSIPFEKIIIHISAYSSACLGLAWSRFYVCWELSKIRPKTGSLRITTPFRLGSQSSARRQELCVRLRRSVRRQDLCAASLQAVGFPFQFH